jgi:hypothetical protein
VYFPGVFIVAHVGKRRGFAQTKLIQSNQLSMELRDPNKVYTQKQIKCKLIVKN